MPKKRSTAKTSRKRESTAEAAVKGLGKGVINGIWYIIKYTFLGIWLLFKTIGKGIYYLFSGVSEAVSEKTVEIKEQVKVQKEEKRITSQQPKNLATYEEFETKDIIKGNLKAFIDQVKKKSTIGIILGARGTGKSALGLRLLENIHAQTGRIVATMGFKREQLPSWISVISNVNEIKNDSFVLIDESGISFSSRKSMSDANTLLSDLILIARHKDVSILFIAQNSANIEINVIRQSDYLLLKPSSLLQAEFERKAIKDMYEEVKDKFEAYEEDKGILYVYSHHFKGFLTNTLPSFWSDKVSKSFKDKTVK